MDKPRFGWCLTRVDFSKMEPYQIPLETQDVIFAIAACLRRMAKKEIPTYELREAFMTGISTLEQMATECQESNTP